MRLPCRLHRRVAVHLLALLLAVLALGCRDGEPAAATDGRADSAGDADSGPDAEPALVWDGGLAQVQLPLVQSNAEGLTPLLTLPASADASRGVLWARTEPGVQLAIARWDGPGGEGLVLPQWLLGPDAPWLCTSGCVVRLAAEPGALAAPWRPALPDARPHQVGLYAFSWQDGQIVPEQTSITAGWLLQEGQIPSQGVLTVTIGLTGALGWNAALAPQLERLKNALQFARDRLAQAGIALQVQYLDWPAANVLVEHTTADLELAALWQAAPSATEGVPIVLVEQLYRQTASGPQPLAGLSGGIPGVPLQQGGPRGGVAVSLALGPGQVDRLGPVLTHELGHFLGLFHTSEAPGSAPQRHDDLTDTADNDPANLMYWSPTEDSTELSAQQAQILRGSPWIRPTK